MYAAMVTEVGAIKEATLKTVEEVKDNLARIQKYAQDAHSGPLLV